jgi:hypothetical protein
MGLIVLMVMGDKSGYRLHNAVDVDNEKDYKCMVINILEQRPKKIKIMVNMKDVQRGCLVLVSYFHLQHPPVEIGENHP